METNPDSKKQTTVVPTDEASESLIRCSGVTHMYERHGRTGRWGRPWNETSGAPTVTALQDVDFSVDRGEIVGIAGPSGSGKSTLLHLIAGLTQPRSGNVEVAGIDLRSLSTAERTSFRYNRVGLVFQRFHLLPSLSARANVALPLIQDGVPKSERRERASELLDRVGLRDREQHLPGELSGGEQQRVAIARALVTDPDIVLADEPTGELDGETGAEVLELLTNTSEARAVVLASHDPASLDIADRVRRLRDGRFKTDDSG